MCVHVCMHVCVHACVRTLGYNMFYPLPTGTWVTAISGTSKGAPSERSSEINCKEMRSLSSIGYSWSTNWLGLGFQLCQSTKGSQALLFRNANIEVVQAERAWYFLSREQCQR